MKNTTVNLRTPYWQQPHMGRLLGYALQRFDERVIALMAQDADVPLALANLAARKQVSAAHIHITRHLSPQGARLTELARQAHMSKQAMENLVDQCEAWGIVMRTPDPHDRRARLIVYTESGLLWLQAFTRAVTQAETEFQNEIGKDVYTVIQIGLEAYVSGYVGTHLVAMPKLF